MTGQSISELARQSTLYPQESPAIVKQSDKNLFIGLPKEISLQENRIALTPDAVALLVRNGHEILVEKGAGEGAKFSDTEYSEAGARIVYSPEEVYEANLIVKIEPLMDSEMDYLKPGQTIISTLKVPNLSRNYFERLNEKRITGIGFELIQDKVGNFPIIRTMSEIAGSTVMLIAAEYLSSAHDGRGMILGGITGVPPTKIVIIGAGTVGEYAARAALGLGAEIKVFDQHIYRLQRLKYSVGQHIYTAIIDSDTLTDALIRADVVIGAMRSDDGVAPMIVTEEMVSRMKPNSIIIDVSIDQGGCFETSEMTTHGQPTFQKYGITHYCVPNIASRVAHTASIALSNVFTPFLLKAGNVGGIEEMIFAKQWFTKGVYCFNGSLTNLPLAQRFNLRYKDLSLLIAARM
ncbi:alanine dehydrogenase/PNT domain protein [Emticicia oligotrophica DSM 17448]|uniref:alanine dehydrogenase n=1 Tax=Emticicia oligotrophica (strain DSM 17448 / CIP 109782 / MTCC 6937 / GPTSA100-15) TaxID=929562 RepID=A0ABM5N3N9_EMTOG|nr:MULTISPECIES: alanine dehydrogenase [Emticicia]AFK04015.1 alanine dehydrogenase/PNT domain protein [Emticicia oligotrophica DSM 17448]